MSDAQDLWDGARAFARAFLSDPAVQAYYREEARQRRIKQEAEDAAYEAKRQAEADEKRRSYNYDRYVLDGGSDPCFQAGHRGRCGTTDCSLFDDEAKRCPHAGPSDFGFPELEPAPSHTGEG